MKTLLTLIIISGILFRFSVTIAQNSETKYKLSEITLTSGETIKAKNISLGNEGISFFKKNSTTGYDDIVKYNFSDLEQVRVATSNKTMPGLLIGTGGGVVASVIVKLLAEKTKILDEAPDKMPWWAKEMTTEYSGSTSYTYDSYGIPIATHSSGGYEVTYKMDFLPMVMITAGGSIAGTIIGASIKKGWKTIFPKSTTMINDVDLNFDLNYYQGCQSGLTLHYKF